MVHDRGGFGVVRLVWEGFVNLIPVYGGDGVEMGRLTPCLVR